MSKKDDLIEWSSEVISQYTQKLTLRQIYYRLVATQKIENVTSNYKALSRALVDGRLDGRIPFDAIEDRTRKIVGGDIEEPDEPQEVFDRRLRAFLKSYWYYNMPRWKDQNYHVEVWVEKEALAGLFQEITDDKYVRLAVCRGYPSVTFLHEAYEFLEGVEDEKEIVILYFGDFDPSGKDIKRNIEEYLNVTFGVDAEIILIAITEEQIEEYNIPPAPTKKSDSRSRAFVAEHGDVAVELDAIEPNVLQDIIRDTIKGYYDEDIWNDVEEDEDEGKDNMKELLKEWSEDPDAYLEGAKERFRRTQGYSWGD